MLADVQRKKNQIEFCQSSSSKAVKAVLLRNQVKVTIKFPFEQNALSLLIDGLGSYEQQYSVDIETSSFTQLSGLK